MPSKKAFFGRSQFIEPGGATFVLTPTIRVYSVAPTVGAGVVQLRDTHARLGGPQHYIVNVSGVSTVEILDPASVSLLVLAVGQTATVFKTPQGWAAAAAKTHAVSLPVAIPLSVATIVLGPGQLFNVVLLDEAQLQIGDFDGSQPVNLTVEIRPGTLISDGGGVSPYALDTGLFPAGSAITIVNKGVIVGRGGDGGDEAPEFDFTVARGGDGGTAIKLRVSTTIQNKDGTILGGGGGGGGGFVRRFAGFNPSGGGGGGGGAGFPVSAGGAGSYNNGRPGASAFGGFGGGGDCTVNVLADMILIGYNDDGSADSSLLNPLSGGMGGAPGMPGQNSDGVIPESGVRTGGAPGLLVESAEFLTWDPSQYGIAQGATADFVNNAVLILVQSYAANIHLNEFLALIGWDEASAMIVQLRLLPGAKMYTPRRYNFTGDLAFIFAQATFIVEDLPAGSIVQIFNEGTVYGYGGWGGRGGKTDFVGESNFYNPSPGEDGGHALKFNVTASTDVQIINADGAIRGGGGGGGGAAGGGTTPVLPNKRGGCGGAGQGQLRSILARPFPSGYRSSLPLIPPNTGVQAYQDLTVDGFQRATLPDFTNAPAHIIPPPLASEQPVTIVDSKESAPGQGGQGTSSPPVTPIDRIGGTGGTWGQPGSAGSGADNLAPPSDHQPGGLGGPAIEGTYTTIGPPGEILGAII